MVPERKNGLMAPLGPVLVCGFAAAVAAWATWFLTHLPWLGLPEEVSLPAILVVWLATLAIVLGKFCQTSIRIGLGAGLVSAIPGALLIGTRLAQPADATGTSRGLIPSAGLVIVGFLALAALVGVVAGLFARLIAPKPEAQCESQPAGAPDIWLSRFALVACVAVVPLLLVGGLVTSTNSGMAVPDWPRTYGSNMFLYPLGPNMPGVTGKPYEQVYFEHSHRLFGTLVGLTTLILAVWVLIREPRKWVNGVAAGAFVLVCVQGLLGGLRVTENSRPLALVHGVLAQLVFALFAFLAVALSPTYLAGLRKAGTLTVTTAQARKAKAFTAGTLHSLILQLLLGAAYRQFRHIHVLYTHIAFSLVVVVMGILAAVTCGSIAASTGPLHRIFSRLGVGLLVVVVIQFMLGWLTFLVGGMAHTPENQTQAIVRTIHQGNGAVFLALATAAYAWAIRLNSAVRASGAATPAAVSPA